MIPCLTSPDVFACYCESIEGDRIRVGILATSEDFEPGIHKLYDPDGKQHKLVIPLIHPYAYDLELSYADIQNTSNA